MKATPLLTITLLLSLAACTTQAEFVKTKTDMSELREDSKAMKARVQELQKRLDQDFQKRLDLLDANIKGTVDVQKVMADYGAKSDQLATDIQLLQGKLEENNFRIAELAQKLDDKSFKMAELSARVEELEGRIKLLSTGVSITTTGQTGTGGGEKRPAPQATGPSDAYRQAKNDFDKGNFDLALAGFQNYVIQFSDTTQASSAQYWIGECYYAKKEFSTAIDSFAKVIKTYPKSEKVAGAKLKIGLSYLNEKNTAKAKEYLNKVIKEHPGTTEAEIAKDRIHKIAK